jgi:hypothetical protein
MERNGNGEVLARGLGWFSLALGAMEVLAPGALAKSLGMRGQEKMLRAYGLREIVSGVGILTSEDPSAWMWARVAGDALDIATLAAHYDDDNRRRRNVGLALANVAAVTLLDVLAARELTMSDRPETFADYGDRTGLPRGVEASRGLARDFEIPRDMRTPEPMRPYDAQ